VGKDEKGGFTVMLGSTADPCVNSGLLPMLIITQGTTAQSMKKFLQPEQAGPIFSAVQGSTSSGIKPNWNHPPPFHKHIADGRVLTVGGHTHWMNPAT
jgi:hypothetical protein